MTNALKIDTRDLAENPSARVPIALCLDTSYSMAGDPISELSEGVKTSYASIFDDEVARFSAEIAIVTFGGEARLRAEFGPVERRPEIAWSASGRTPMGEAVRLAMNELDSRKRHYRSAGVDYFQPWLVLMTDGMPTDDWEEIADKVAGMVANKRLTVFPIGIGEDVDMSVLERFSPDRGPLRLRGLQFGSFFEWLSASVQRVSASVPGERVPLDTDGIKGWAEV